MTTSHVSALRARCEASHPLATACIIASWALGQRLGDFLQLALSDFLVSQVRDRLLLCITIRRGKVMSVTQPYTLFLQADTYPATALLKAAKEARTHQQLFLCSNYNTKEEREAFAHLTAVLITSVDEHLEMRSVRRGGLQEMATRGCSLAEILTFSNHRSEDMLLRYLNWGQMSTTRATAMSTITDMMLSDI